LHLCMISMAISRAKLSGFITLLVLLGGGGLSLYGCSGHTNSSKILNATESATFPVNSTQIATKETVIPLFPATPTPKGQPQTSSADLAIEFTPAIDDGSNQKNIYTLTVHNLGRDPATDILITSLFPTGTNADQIHLLQPICQLQDNQVACDVGNVQSDHKVGVTLDFSSGPDKPVIPEIQRTGLSPNITLPVCWFEQITARPTRLKCYLESLEPGKQTQMQLKLDADIEPGVYTFSVAAKQMDPDPSNNVASAAVAATAVDSARLPDLTIQANGPAEVVAGQPFTYTYQVINQGTQPATEVTFDDPIPPGMNLNNYAPGLPLCEQKGDRLTCSMVDPDSGKRASFTLTIKGNEQQPILMDVDPLMPGWPACYVLKERGSSNILHCDLGTLQPGQSTHVRLDMLAIGVQERTMTNTVVVHAQEPDLAPADHSNSTNIMVQVQADLLVDADRPIWSANKKTLSFVIRVENLGPSAADGSTLTGVLPSDTRIASMTLTPERECLVEVGNKLVCKLSYIKSGEMETLNIVLSADHGVAPQNQAEAFLHSLQVASKGLDPNSDNNVIAGPMVIRPEDGK
jgi:uncharacterized repeat protein (TIGR01451 family)